MIQLLQFLNANVLHHSDELAEFRGYKGEVIDVGEPSQTVSVFGSIRRGSVGPEAANEDILVSLWQQTYGSHGIAGIIVGFRWDQAYAYIAVGNNTWVSIRSEQTFTETDRAYLVAYARTRSTMEAWAHHVAEKASKKRS